MTRDKHSVRVYKGRKERFLCMGSGMVVCWYDGMVTAWRWSHPSEGTMINKHKDTWIGKQIDMSINSYTDKIDRYA